MNITQSLETVAAWIWQSSWQASVLVALVLLVQRLFAKQLAPNWRYGLWLLVVIRLILPTAPETSLSVFNWVGAAPAADAISALPALPTLAHGHEKPNRQANLDVGTPDPQTSDSDLGEAATGLPAVRPTPALSTKTILSLIWLAGAALLSAFLLWQYWRFKRRLIGSVPIKDHRALEILGEVRDTVGLKRAPALLETDHVDSPALFGFLGIRLLLPRGLIATLSADELRHVLLHEAAHLKRGDMPLNWLITVLQVVHWFNPVLWLAFARLRADREIACDALALSHANDGEGRSYAQTIIKLLEGCARPKALPGLVGILEDKNQMKRRITMIAKFKTVRRWSGLALLLIAGLGLVALTDAQDKKFSDTDKLIEEIRKMGGKVTFADDKPSGSVVGVTFDAYDEYREDYLKTPEFNDGLLARVSQFSELRELNVPGTAVTDEGLSHLKNLKHLEKLSLAETVVTDVGLGTLKPLSELKELNVSETSVSEDGLKHLNNFPQLRSLGLQWLGISDAGLVHLKNCPQLEKLDLWRNKLTDAGLSHLSSLVNLRELGAGGSRITGSGFEQIKALKDLRRLGLPLADLTDEGMKSLQYFRELQSLNLNLNRQITDAGISSLKGLTKLAELYLNGAGITSDGLAHLTNLANLRDLGLHTTRIDDAGLRHLEKLSQIEVLGLTRTAVTEAGLESLVKLPKLKQVHLGNTKIGKAGLATLKKAQSLESLHLHLTDPSITDEDLTDLKHLRGLKYLTLSGSRITDGGLKHLRELEKLEGLYLARTAVTDAGLANLRDLQQLREISLSRTAVVDAGLANLRDLSELQSLELADTKVTGFGISHLARSSKLRWLDLGGSPVQDDALSHLKALTALSDLNLRDTKITDAGLVHLAGLARLRSLQLDRTAVTDQGLVHLRRLSNLSDIALRGTRVTDDGITHLLRFRELFALFLDDAPISDSGLSHLKALPKLHNLSLGGTRITRNGLLHLKAIPRLRWVALSEGLVNEKFRAELKQAYPDLTIRTVATKTETQAALDAILKSAEEKQVNPNGTWKWFGLPQREWVLKLKREGESFTGTITGPDAVATTIQEPKIEGDVITFQEIREANGIKISNKYAGKIIGDTIQGKREAQIEGGALRIADWQPKREIAK